ELCGYQKGAFLGAMQTQKGLFEQANTGTIFLDAVDALTPPAQEALLRLVKEHSVLRQGGTDAVPVDVRIIAATSASLETLAEQGRFSRELYERLSACALHVPPLRERREDIVPLVEHLLKQLSGDGEEQIKRISFPALELMTRYFWPGNISELNSALQRAAQYCEDHVIRAGDLPPSLQTAESSATEAGLSLGDAVIRFEKEMLVDALIKAGGNMLKAARDLKSSYRIVNYKVKKYGIDPHQFVYKNRSL
ncbi:MAG: sigma-54-dependent Fis family transcriptional regulator, partial [Mailhella sp.]|nr:sigma-54-dependent Fis family transcriptional regulator [Mailhella sp.]